MPLYEMFTTSDRMRGVYDYPNEASMINFMMLFPDVENLRYNEVNEKRAEEIRIKIKQKLERRVRRLISETWAYTVDC